ncbi:MAG: hypothetical protein NT165_02500 [Candidatus Falkowbacteria bacterium]|nr:hypothetical protein [Candidatus Falkowbacteria bacterium]
MQNKKIIGLPKKTLFAIVGGLIVIAVVLSAVFMNKGKTLSPEAAKIKTEAYINENLMPSGSKVKIESIKEYEGNLYQLKINLGNGQTVDSYVSKDGTKFFPQSMDMKAATGDDANKAPSAAKPTTKAAGSSVSTKTAKPVVELFVMSYCPYGTQIEKGIIPAVEALGNKIDFKLKFVSYAMHGEKELKENLVQYCIQKDSPSKLLPYLNCFLKEGKSADCLTQNNLNVTACVDKSDKQFKVTENYTNKVGWQGSFPPFDTDKADNEKYNVQGSPTLIINGEETSSSRDSASLLTTICSAFDKTPEACNTKLPSTAPSSGFGTGSASGGAAAQCGS